MACLCIAVSCCFGLLVHTQIYNAAAAAKVQNGILDLSETDFYINEYIYLNGEWRYINYRPEIKNSRQTDEGYMPVNVPGRWLNKNIESTAFYGTEARYKILLKNVSAGERMVIAVPGLLQRHEMYVDGRRLPNGGREGFVANKSTAEVVLAIESKMLDGLYLTPRIFTYSNYIYWNGVRSFWMSVLFGGLIFSALFFFIISIAGKKKNPYRYLFLVGLVTVGRYILRIFIFFGGASGLFAETNMEAFVPVTMMLTIFCVLCMLYMAADISKDDKDKKIRNVFALILIAGMATACFAWGIIYYKWLWGLLFCMMVWGFVFITIIMIRAIRKGVDHALLMGVGILVIFAGLLVDALDVNGRLAFDGSFVLPLCIAAFMVLYAAIISLEEKKHYAFIQSNMKMQKEMTAMEAAAMAQRMQPHFLYNTLTAIQEMCYTEPQKAADTIGNFASYLRISIDFLKMPEEIPFERELTFINYYMQIQKARYGSYMQLETNITEPDFTILPFTVEPLIENAVKHKLKSHPQNVRILLSAQKTTGGICVSVEDDGAGFDVEKEMEADGYNTLSIIRRRLKYWKNAALTIESSCQKGTRAVIFIPCNGEEKQ